VRTEAAHGNAEHHKQGALIRSAALVVHTKRVSYEAGSGTRTAAFVERTDCCVALSQL
jgi:hypothetical protein